MQNKTGASCLDVTKINIAVTNFADVGATTLPSSDQHQKDMKHFFSSASNAKKATIYSCDNVSTYNRERKNTFFESKEVVNNSTKEKKRKNLNNVISSSCRKSTNRTNNNHELFLQEQHEITSIDPKVLAELPPDIVSEVIASYRNNRNNVKKKGKIDCYFSKK